MSDATYGNLDTLQTETLKVILLEVKRILKRRKPNATNQ